MDIIEFSMACIHVRTKSVHFWLIFMTLRDRSFKGNLTIQDL